MLVIEFFFSLTAIFTIAVAGTDEWLSVYLLNISILTENRDSKIIRRLYFRH